MDLRYSIGRLMIGVVAVAVLLGVMVGLRRRSLTFQERADDLRYDRMKLLYRLPPATRSSSGGEMSSQEVMDRLRHYRELIDRYDLASRRPWLSVAE